MMEKIQKVLLVLCIFIPVLILCGSNGQKTNLNDGCGEYVFVAAGEFDMGDLFNEGAPSRNSRRRPRLRLLRRKRRS